MATELTYDQLKTLYAWIDAIPLSRPKRNICRDFSDGVMMAEVIAAYYPHLVELHNYPPANSTKQKIYNYETLNQRVLKRFGYQIPHYLIEDIVNCKQGAIEGVLNTLQFKMAKYRERKEAEPSPPTSSRRAPPQQGFEHAHGLKNNNQQQPSQQQQQQPTNGHGGAGHPSAHAHAHANPPKSSSVDAEILLEKEQIIRELTANVEILELKVGKLEQLVRLKDAKIQKLMGQQQQQLK